MVELLVQNTSVAGSSIANSAFTGLAGQLELGNLLDIVNGQGGPNLSANLAKILRRIDTPIFDDVIVWYFSQPGVHAAILPAFIGAYQVSVLARQRAIRSALLKNRYDAGKIPLTQFIGDLTNVADVFGLRASVLNGEIYELPDQDPTVPAKIAGPLLYVLAKRIRQAHTAPMVTITYDDLRIYAGQIKAVLGLAYDNHARTALYNASAALPGGERIIDALTALPAATALTRIKAKYFLDLPLEVADVMAEAARLALAPTQDQTTLKLLYDTVIRADGTNAAAKALSDLPGPIGGERIDLSIMW